MHFITFEGPEGAGKTTILRRVVQALQHLQYDVISTREPGGIPIAESIRHVILDCAHTMMDERTEALLYAAARRQHLIERIIPALRRGQIVLCDRFIDSSLAYQGYARGIGIEEVQRINAFAIEGWMPTTTFYFDVPPEVGLARIQKNASREVNRLDREQLSFHQKVYEGYAVVQQLYSERIIVVDATKCEDEVYAFVMEQLLSMFNA